MPSSQSEVDIINRALSKIGAQRISARGEDNNRGRIMDSLYEPVRDELLRECPWNFAIARDSLAADPVAPIYEWATAFDVPADLLYMVSSIFFASPILPRPILKPAPSINLVISLSILLSSSDRGAPPPLFAEEGSFGNGFTPGRTLEKFSVTNLLISLLAVSSSLSRRLLRNA